VFLVWNEAQDRTEAVSVMDMAAMRESGNEPVAESEVRLSFLLSRLVQQGRCRHFVRVYQLLRCSTPPPADWGNADNKQPKGSLSCYRKALGTSGGGGGGGKVRGRPPRVVTGDFQYIRMELCDGGDLEEALRLHPRPCARVVADLLRQMSLSLLFAQQELRMRHYDVKLLNFFLKSERVAPRAPRDEAAAAAAASPAAPPPGAGGAFWEQPGREWVVKLADYGTAETDEGSMREALQDRHVTTWENVLPALLLWGDRCVGARQ
jgi:hypothetical protein